MDNIQFFLDEAGQIIDFHLSDLRNQELSWQNRRGLLDLIVSERLESKSKKHFYIFSRAVDDFILHFLQSDFHTNTLSKLESGEIDKVIFYCEDMDWFSYMQPRLDEVIEKLHSAYGTHIDKFELYLPSFSEFEYEPIKRFHSFGFLTFRLGYYLKFRFFNLDFDKIEKHFYSANNFPRASRLHFYKFLKDNNLFQYGNYSFFNFANIPFDENREFTYEQREDDGGLRKIKSDYKFSPVKFFNEQGSEYTAHEIIKQLNSDVVKNSAIEVVFETAYCKDDFMQFSEKTMKSLMSPRPFILFSYPFSLKKLKDMGFKTFDFLFDESYDEIVDHDQRLYYIFEQIKYISYLDIEDIRKVLEEHKDVFIHNRDLLMQFHKNEVDIIRKLICS